MAHFAEISESNVVLRVLVVPDDEEPRGQEYLADDLGLGGTWVQTSYNGRVRSLFAGVDYNYDPDDDVFYRPSPYPSWVLDADTKEWGAPVALPADADTVTYRWDEDTTSWVEVT